MRNPHLFPVTFVKILQTTNQFALDRLSFLIFINKIIITIIILMIAIMTVIIAIQIKQTSTSSGVTVLAIDFLVLDQSFQPLLWLCCFVIGIDSLPLYLMLLCPHDVMFCLNNL